VGSYAAMFICNVFPRQTFYPLFLGSVVEAIGFGVLAWAISQRKSALVNIMMTVSGGGTGLRMMPVALHAAGIWPEKLAPVMSFMSFMSPFGGTLSIAIMSSVFYNKFTGVLVSVNHDSITSSSKHNSTQSIQAIDSLPDAIQLLVRQKAARAVMWSFISVLPLMGLGVFSVTWLGNVWINPKAPKANESPQGTAIHSSYLVAAFPVGTHANL
jgi:hypothetical protein